MCVFYRTADLFRASLVESAEAEIVVISADNIETLLLGEPKVAMRFLKQMALRLQNSHQHAVV